MFFSLSRFCSVLSVLLCSAFPLGRLPYACSSLHHCEARSTGGAFLEVYRYLVSGTSTMGPETADDLPIPLSSVYAFTRGEPEFTNSTPGFTGTLDYIFFSPSEDIKPVSYLELPDTESSDVNGSLPNYFHPSDHLPVGAEFEVEA